MPELPDVEVFRRCFDQHALRRKITGSELLAPEMISEVAGCRLCPKLGGMEFANTRRHGKHLLAQLRGSGWLMLHFEMTGYLWHGGAKEECPAHVRFKVKFSNNSRLCYVCQRKLGEIGYTFDTDTFIRKRGLGPDAFLELGKFEDFARRLKARRGSVKAALTDQRIIAGIGNVYADEILFQARLHPRHDIRTLETSRLRNVHAAMLKTLETAIEAEVDEDLFPPGFLFPNRSKEGRCPRCRKPLAVTRISNRSSIFCLHCQS